MKQRATKTARASRSKKPTLVTEQVRFRLPNFSWRKADLLRALDADFDAFVDDRRSLRGMSSTTLRWYEHAYRNFRSFLIEGRGLRADAFQLRINAIDEWTRWNRARKISPVTVNTYWRALHAFFQSREQRTQIPSPFRLAARPRIPAYLPKALPAAECGRILLAANNYPWKSAFERHRARASIALMLYAGLRRGELLRLLYSDVQLGDGTIRIVRGKGPHGGKDRIAYIPPELRLILADYLRVRQQRQLVNPEFISSTRGGPFTIPMLRECLLKVQRAAGIPFTAHVLRHSFVTNMLKCGIPIHIAKELAGHTDIETTMGYLRVFDDEKQAQVRKIRY